MSAHECSNSRKITVTIPVFTPAQIKQQTDHILAVLRRIEARQKEVGWIARQSRRIKALGAKFLSFFKSNSLPPLPAAVAEPQLTQKESRRKPEPRSVPKQTIGQLLDGMDLAFKELSRADDSASWTNQSLRNALRAIGPTIGYPGEKYDSWQVDVSGDFKPPALLFVATLRRDDDAPTGAFYPKFLYANKIAKLPAGVVSESNGIPYECGACWAHELTGNRTFWSSFHVTINPATGKVSVCHTRKSNIYRVPGSRTLAFNRPEWCLDGIYETPQKIITATSIMFNAARLQDSMWKVSAKKDGRRMTFCIPDNHAPSFFSERDRQALSPEGRMRPIIHMVEAHDRVLGDGRTTKVRTHIRGLRNFDWNGYECAIVAPKFHTFTANSFDSASVESDDAEAPEFVDAARVGKLLADLEDSQPKTRPMAANMLCSTEGGAA
jgi:hypothetical protein